MSESFLWLQSGAHLLRPMSEADKDPASEEFKRVAIEKAKQLIELGKEGESK